MAHAVSRPLVAHDQVSLKISDIILVAGITVVLVINNIHIQNCNIPELSWKEIKLITIKGNLQG